MNVQYAKVYVNLSFNLSAPSTFINTTYNPYAQSLRLQLLFRQRDTTTAAGRRRRGGSMVNDTAQLYTIEGVAAGLIMLLTVYFVFNTTSVYTPGDAHISDMQMEVLGSDALRMMDTPPSMNSSSPLVGMIQNDQGDQFKTMFLNYTDNRTLLGPDNIKFTASYTCRDCNGNCADPNLLQQTESIPITSNRNLTGGSMR